MKGKILVSACLLGRPCRYDGKSVPCQNVMDLCEEYELVPICPEVEGGLCTPRIPSERIGGRVVNKGGTDVTDNYKKGAALALSICKRNGIGIAVLKEKSPSCGTHIIYDGSFSGQLIGGMGVTAELLSSEGIKVISEDEVSVLTK